MRAALIAEEQIKKIKFVLEELMYSNSTALAAENFLQALAIVKSLKVMDHDAVDSAWNKFNKAISDGPTSPFPEMAARFESYYSQSWTDKDWRKETSIWAAAWKEAIAYQKNLIGTP